jgi:nucleotide-binding universal stress UspA family protein
MKRRRLGMSDVSVEFEFMWTGYLGKHHRAAFPADFLLTGRVEAAASELAAAHGRPENTGMRWPRSLLTAGESLIDRVLCVVGAVLFSQAPEFMQQYLQRLGGHLAEARRQLAQFEQIARQAGQSLQDLIVRYSANSDPTVVRLGELISDTEKRVVALAQAESALRNASLWERPFVFLHHVDAEIARSTGEVFKPAVPTTIEGLLYATAGLVVFLSLYHGAVRPLVTRLWTMIVRRPASKQPA